MKQNSEINSQCQNDSFYLNSPNHKDSVYKCTKEKQQILTLGKLHTENSNHLVVLKKMSCRLF